MSNPYREMFRLVDPRPATAEPAWQALREVLVGQIHGRDVDWSAVAAAARHGEVVTIAAEAHPELSARLAKVAQRQILVDMHLELALDRISRAFELAGIHTSALLKGSATAYSLYDTPAHRIRRDVDVLVRSADMLDAIKALRDDGWRDDPPKASAARGPLALRAWPMVLELPIGLVSCDLHRRLTYGGRFRIDEDGVLRRAARGLAKLPVSSLEDTFLHTVIHMVNGGFKEALKGWVDLIRLLEHPDVSLTTIARRARLWRCRAATWACLHVAQRWFGARVPEALQRRVAPPLWQRQALRYVLSGNGADPIRKDLSKHGAIGATAMLVCDDARSRARWLGELAWRRVSGTPHL